MIDIDGEGSQSDNSYGWAETIIVVVTLFLIEICYQYPEISSNIVSDALCKIISHLNIYRREWYWFVRNRREHQFERATHVCVVFMRNLPRTRVLALKYRVVGWMVHVKYVCIFGNINWSTMFPLCLTTELLLLDVIEQKTGALPDESKSLRKYQQIIFRSVCGSQEKWSFCLKLPHKYLQLWMLM